MPRANREELLAVLQSVQPGLSAREIIEQSSCFVFKEGQVITYNDEVACRRIIDPQLKLEGAVHAAPLLAVLSKMPETDIELWTTDKQLRIKGKRRAAGINMDKDIQLPFDSVALPQKWKKLEQDFGDAVDIVQACVGKDESKFWTTCIRIMPDYIEGTDNYQYTRYTINTDLKEPIIVKKDSIKNIVPMGMTRYGITDSWVHFKNPAGMIVSCRRYIEEYPDFGPWVAMRGKKINLPKGLGDAIERSEIFSAQNTEVNRVDIELKRDLMTIKGDGTTGWYRESKKIIYKGKPIKFIIAPRILIEVSKKHNDCEVCVGKDGSGEESKALRVDGGKFVYMSSLQSDDEKESDEDQD